MADQKSTEQQGSEQHVYDYFGLKEDGLPDADIYHLGNEKVNLLNIDDAYKAHGQGQDLKDFTKKYDEVEQSFLNFKNQSYLKDATSAKNLYPFKIPEQQGLMVGVGPGGTNVKTGTNAQISSLSNIVSHGQETDLRAEDVSPWNRVQEYKPDGTPYWRLREEGESTAGKEVGSIFGDTHQYSSAINQAWSGIFNSTLAELPSGVIGIGKVAGDLGESLYNAAHGKGWTASGTSPWDTAYNNTKAFSKSLENINDDQQNNMWYEFNNGLGSLFGAVAAGYAGAKAGKALGLNPGIGGGVQKLSSAASVGIGSMQVMDNFIEQAKAANIPDAEIAIIAPIFGTITAWSESKLGPGWVFHQYEKAGAKKIFQKEFIDPLIMYAEKNGIKSMEEMPKSAYGKAVNNMTSKLGKLWYGLKTGEGALYNIGEGAVGEGLEELTEGGLDNLVMKGYDAFKVNYSSLTTKDKEKLQKNNGLFYEKDFSPGQIYDDVTTGLGHQAFMGALTGGIANVGTSMYNKVMQRNTQKNAINEAIINGQTDELKKAITDAYENNPNWPGADWTDGQKAVTIDINGQKTSKSIKDMVYEQAIANIDLMKEMYDKSGIKNPDFIRNQLGGNKSLAYSALDAFTQMKQGEAKLAELQKAKKEAQDAGTWVEPINAEADEILTTQQKIKSNEGDLQYISSGNAYSDKLKNGLVFSYGIQNKDLIADYKAKKDLPRFITSPQVDAFNASLPQSRLQTIKDIQDAATNRVSNLETHGERIAGIASSSIDNDFFDSVDALLADVRKYGMTTSTATGIADALTKKQQEQKDIYESSESPQPTAEETTAMEHANKLSGHIADFQQITGFTPKTTFDNNEFLLDQYFPNREALNKMDVDNEEAKKIILANPNLIADGGEIDGLMDDIKLARQLASVNHNVYSTLEDKYTGLAQQDKLTAEQLDMLLKEADVQEARLTKIKEESEKAVNDRKVEQKKINLSYLKQRNFIADFAIKMSKVIDNVKAKEYMASLHGAMDAIEAGDNSDEVIGKAEKAMTQLESLLHEELKTDKKLKGKIIEQIIATKRRNTGKDLTSASLMQPIEFLGADFDKIFDVRSLQGLEKEFSDSYHETFAVFQINNYLNDIERLDSNKFVKTLSDALVNWQGPTPSYEQIQSIRQLTGFLSDSSNEWIKEYQDLRAKHNKSLTKSEIDKSYNSLIKNAIFLRGFAGGGKTTVILPLAIKMHQLLSSKTDINVLHVAPTQNLVDKLVSATSAVTGKAFSDAIKTKDFIAQDKNITSKYDLVVLDEASLLGPDDINKIRDLQAKGVKIIFIGDQSQMSNSLTPNRILPIETMMERTVPVTVSFRNSSVDINLILAAYRKAIFNNLDVKLFPVTHNEVENFGAKYYATEENIINSFVNDINNGVKPWIIVSGVERRNAVIDKLISKGVNSLDASALVKTIEFDDFTAQGLENSKVYVAIRKIDTISLGYLQQAMYNRMMLTAVSRTGSKNTNIGFVGILDESGQGVSTIGKPIESRGIEVDKTATISKLTNMYTDKLKPEEPKKVIKKESISEQQLSKALDRILKGEKGIVEKSMAAFELTDEELTKLVVAEKAVNNKDLSVDSKVYIEKLIALGWSSDDISNMTQDDLKTLATNSVKKRPAPVKGQDIREPATKKLFFIKSANIFKNTGGSIPINAFAVLSSDAISQENINQNPGQKAKIDLLAKWHGLEGDKQVVIKYHPTLALSALEDGAAVSKNFTNVFGIWSDNTENAVFLGTLFHADKGFTESELGIDNVVYPGGGANVKTQIENGFIEETDVQKRTALINYHKAMVDLKIAAASDPNGVTVLVDNIDAAQLVAPMDNDKVPTLAEFKSNIKKYGEGRVQLSVPYQITDGKGKVSLAMKVSFLGNPENGVEVQLKMDNLNKSDVLDILHKDGVEKDDYFIGLLGIEDATLQDLVTSRASSMLDYNRSVIKEMLGQKIGVDKFLYLDKNGLDIKLLGSNATEKFKNLVEFYKFLENNEDATSKMFVMPKIINQVMNKQQGTRFNLDDLESIQDRIKVDVNKNNPLRFPTFTITTTPLKIDSQPTPYIISKDSGAPGSADLREFLNAKSVTPGNTITTQRIDSEKAVRIIRNILGDSIGIKLSDELYSQNGKALYGVARKGYIGLENKGGVEISTPRHEALHIVMNFILDPKYYRELLDTAKQVISDTNNTDITTITDIDAEEFMAGQYGKTEGVPPHPLLAPIWRFLSWLRNVLNNVKTNQDILDNFYNEIEYGKYYGESFNDNSTFTERTNVSEEDDYNNQATTNTTLESEAKDPEVIANKKEFGDLHDYNGVAKLFGSIEVADKLKPAFKRSIVRYMFPTTIMQNGQLISNLGLLDTMNKIQQDYELQAKSLVTPEFIKKLADEKIHGNTVLEKLPKEEMYMYALHHIANDKSILRRYFQSIFPDVDVAKLIKTGNVNYAMRKKGEDTISKKENELVDVAASRSAFLNLILDSIPNKNFGYKGGRFVNLGDGKGIVNGDIIKRALEDAGGMGGKLNNFDTLRKNLITIAQTMTYMQDGIEKFTEKGNAIHSLLSVFGVRDAKISDPSTWTYGFISENPEIVERQFPGIENAPLWDMHCRNAANIVNSLTSSFLSLKKENPIQTRIQETQDDETGQRIAKMTSVVLKPSLPDSIKHQIKDSSTMAIFSQAGNQVIVNPDLANKLQRAYVFEKYIDGIRINSNETGEQLLFAKFGNGKFDLDINPNIRIDDVRTMFRIVGINMNKRALDIFWSNRSKDIMKGEIGEYPFDIQRVVEIASAMLISAKTLADTDYQNDQNVVGILTKMMNTAGSSTLDPATSAAFKIPAPADFYRMVEQLANANAASIGDKFRGTYYTVDGARAYVYTFSNSFHDDFGHGGRTISEDGATMKQDEMQTIIDDHLNNGTQVQFAKTNALVYVENGKIEVGNMILTKNPLYHIRIGEKHGNKGVLSDFKGNAYGKTATVRDVANSHITPFIEAVLEGTRTKHQTIPMPGPTRADSTDNEIMNFYFPEGNIVSKDGITTKGRQMIDRMLERVFGNYQRELETSVERWNNYLTNLGFALTPEQLNEFKDNPYAFRAHLNNVLIPSIANLNESVVFGNSGLYENKDYVIKNGKIDLGNATLFNTEIIEKDGAAILVNKDDIFNHANYQKLYNGPNEQFSERLKSIFAPGYFEMAKYLTSIGYKIPSSINQDFFTKNEDGSYSFSPVYEAYYLFHHIIQNSLYPVSLGNVNQYKSIVDYFKRDKEGPGTIFKVGGRNGLFETYNNGIITDHDGYHHEQLEQMGLIDPSMTVNMTDGIQLMSPTFQQEVYDASGGELGPLGKGQYKLSHREFDLSENIMKYVKSSSLYFSPEILDLASTFGRDDLLNKNNYFEETLQRMYSTTRLEENTPSLYEEFSNFRRAVIVEKGVSRQITFKEATAKMVKFLKDNPNRRSEVNDVLTFKSAFKTSTNALNKDGGNFNSITPTKMSSSYLRHQTNTDQESDDAHATSAKQMFGFIGMLAHNKQYADSINDAQVKIAQNQIESINNRINSMPGDNYRSQFHNFLREIGKDQAISINDYGTITQALNSKDISLEPSLIKNKVVSLFLKQTSKAMRFKSAGIRVVQNPALFSVYEGSDGITYTLADIKEMTPLQASDLGLSDNVGRMLHTDRVEDGIMKPAEVVGTYIHKRYFGIKEGESLHKVMSIRMKDGKSVRTDNMTDEEIKKFITRNIDDIDIQNTPMMRQVGQIGKGDVVFEKNYTDVIDYITKFKKSLLGVNVRVPAHGPGSGQYRKLVGWISDYSSVQFGNPLKTLLNGSDYDADQLSDYSWSPDNELDNQILDAMIGFYSDIRNHAFINTPLSTKEEEAEADKVKGLLKLQPGAYDTSLKIYKANNDGKQIIDRFAIAGKLYGLAYQAYMNDSSLFTGFNFNAEAVDNFNQLVNTITGKFLQLSVDNAKLQVLGIIGANPDSVDAIMGIIMSKDKINQDRPDIDTKFKEIADFLQRKHIKDIFNAVQSSGSIDDSKKKVYQISRQQREYFEGLIANPEMLSQNQYKDVPLEKLQGIVSDIKLLEHFDISGQALLRLNTIFKLDSKGMPTKDYERYNMLHGAFGIEFTLGMPIEEFLKDNGQSFLSKNPEWFMEKRSMMPIERLDKFTITKQEELERERKIRAMVNYPGVVQALPLIKEYISIANDIDNKINDNFLIGSSIYKVAKQTALVNAGYNNWLSEDQYKEFDREFEKLVISTYLNQTNYKINDVENDTEYTLRTPQERSRFIKQFSAWFKNYLADNPSLVETNMFLRNIQVGNNGFDDFIFFPYKDGFSNDMKAAIQSDANKLKDKQKFKFETDGKVISNISIFDALLVYQLAKEDFSGKKSSYMDMLGDSGFKNISMYIESTLLPSIKANKNLNLYDSENNPIQKTFSDIIDSPWSLDVFNRQGFNLLQKGYKAKIAMWSRGDGPKYFLKKDESGTYSMHTFNDKGEVERIYNKNTATTGYSVDQSLSRIGKVKTATQPQSPVSREVKKGVSELFESNPELANALYKALGFNQNNVEEFQGFWNRQQVASQLDKVFLFGDNTNDRTITKYVPSVTQAVIRGLSNAIGIDTKKDRGTTNNSYLTDNDFDWFKNHVDTQIQKAKNSGKTIVIPADGIGTGKAMLKEKAPKLFEYLQKKLNELKESQITPQQKQQALQLYSQYLDTVFSDSKVNDIVYHGTKSNEVRTVFDKKSIQKTGVGLGKGFFFAGDKSYAERDAYGYKSIGAYLLNLKNPIFGHPSTFIEDNRMKDVPKEYIQEYPEGKELKKLEDFERTELIKKLGYDGVVYKKGEYSNENIVFEPEQIYILGSKKDIEGFKDFVTQPVAQTVTQQQSGVTEEVQEMKIPATYMKDLIAGKSITIPFPEPSRYHQGLVMLDNNREGMITYVSPDFKNVTISLSKQLPLFAMSLPGETARVDSFITSIKMLNGQNQNASSAPKNLLIRTIAERSDDILIKKMMTWINQNPAVARLVNNGGRVIYVDPATIDAESLNVLIQQRRQFNDDRYIIGGGYNTQTGDIYIHPQVGNKDRIFMHELIHNFTVDALLGTPINAVEQRYQDSMNAIFRNITEYAAINNIEFKYGFNNVAEMVSEAFSNVDFQKFLADIPTQKGSMWERFTDIIRDFLVNDLGIPKELLGNNALGDIIAETTLFIDVNSKLVEVNPALAEFMKNNIFASKIDAKEYFEKCK